MADECTGHDHISEEEMKRRAEQLDDALKTIMAENAPMDGMMVSDFALVLEYVDREGDYMVVHIGAQNSPAHRTRGLLYEALREVPDFIVGTHEDD